jgi:hypothetical protein
MQKSLVSVKTAGDILDLAPVTVLRLFDQGVLPGIIIAQRARKRIIKFRPEVLERFIANRERRGHK